MTSCFTSASISCMRATSTRARSRRRARRLGRRLAALGEHVDERQLDVEPALRAGPPRTRGGAIAGRV